MYIYQPSEVAAKVSKMHLCKNTTVVIPTLTTRHIISITRAALFVCFQRLALNAKSCRTSSSFSSLFDFHASQSHLKVWRVRRGSYSPEWLSDRGQLWPVTYLPEAEQSFMCTQKQFRVHCLAEEHFSQEEAMHRASRWKQFNLTFDNIWKILVISPNILFEITDFK